MAPEIVSLLSSDDADDDDDAFVTPVPHQKASRWAVASEKSLQRSTTDVTVPGVSELVGPTAAGPESVHKRLHGRSSSFDSLSFDHWRAPAKPSLSQQHKPSVCQATVWHSDVSLGDDEADNSVIILSSLPDRDGDNETERRHHSTVEPAANGRAPKRRRLFPGIDPAVTDSVNIDIPAEAPPRKQPPAAIAECIDLTDSPLPNGVSEKAYAYAVEKDSFITEPRHSPVATQSGLREHQHTETLSLLSSSPPSRWRMTGTETAAAYTQATNTSWRTRTSFERDDSRTGRRVLSRSISLTTNLPSRNPAVLFDDDDDDADNYDDLNADIRSIGPTDFTDIDTLLAAWKKEKTVSGIQPGRDSTMQRREINKRQSQRFGVGSRAAQLCAAEAAVATGHRESGATKSQKPRLTAAEKEQRQRDKEAEKEQRQRDREVEKERRRVASILAKESKAAERAAAAAFGEANKSRTDKKKALPEMVVKLPDSLSQATKEVVEQTLAEESIENETWASPVDNVVVWWRKVTTEYRVDLGHWVSVPMRKEREKYAVVIVSGEELARMIKSDDDGVTPEGLRHHVDNMRQHFPTDRVLYLIEGLEAWRSKSRSIKNRQFAAAVRNAETAAVTDSTSQSTTESGRPPPQLPGARASGRAGRAAVGSSRQQRQQQPRVEEERIVDALMELQMEHDMLIHETVHAVDTARWIRCFTEQISTAPYKTHREQQYAAAASFCMDTGQIETGDSGPETYALMLQQIARVTEPVALGLTTRFDSLRSLTQRMAEEGPLALEACLLSRGRNKAPSERTVGQALSRRIYNVFMGQCESSTDI